MQHISDLHSKFAHVWKYGRKIGEEKKKKKKETTG